MHETGAVEFCSPGLRELSRRLGLRGSRRSFLNETFQLRLHEKDRACTCGYLKEELAWEAEHPHASDCYQSELARRSAAAGDDPEELSRVYAETAADFGLPELGAAMHCTCGQQARWDHWRTLHAHHPDCPLVRPHFRHHASGLELRWWVTIGRHMDANQDLDEPTWSRVLDDCRRSLLQ